MQSLALGVLGVVLGTESDLPDGAAVPLDHILVAGPLQIDLRIDGRVLAVVDGVRLDEEVGGGVLVLRLQPIAEEALQAVLQLVELLRSPYGLFVGDVAHPGALGPGAGGSSNGLPRPILAEILKLLGITLRGGIPTSQSEVLLDELDLGEGHLALALVQAPNGAVIPTELVRIVALFGLLAEGTEIRILLLQGVIRTGVGGVVADQTGLAEELGQCLELPFRGGDLRIAGDLQDLVVLQLGDGDPVADIPSEASVAGLGAAQLLEGLDGGGLLHQDNALITEGGWGGGLPED